MTPPNGKSGIDRYPVQPGQRITVLFEFSEVAVEAEEDFLGGVLGVLLVTKKAKGSSQYGPLIAPYEGFECPAVA
jgi:hypothetical protein